MRKRRNEAFTNQGVINVLGEVKLVEVKSEESQ